MIAQTKCLLCCFFYILLSCSSVGTSKGESELKLVRFYCDWMTTYRAFVTHNCLFWCILLVPICKNIVESVCCHSLFLSN